MTRLSVNVNKVALLRNSRSGTVPDVVKTARLALEAGAAGITIHPRPDQRHIRPEDVQHLTQLLAEPAYTDRELNIEGNPFQAPYMSIVKQARPAQCTLVPDDPNQATSDHGWNPAMDLPRLEPVVAELRKLGCRVSLFMDPDDQLIESVPPTGADRIELYTETFAIAHARGGPELEQTHLKFATAAAKAQDLGLGVNAGHDLNQVNLGRFLTIPKILEVSIGHALIADALETGLSSIVKAYLRLVEQ